MADVETKLSVTTLPKGDMGAAVAKQVLEAAAAAIAARGRFVIALSGGSMSKMLAPALLAAADDTDWSCWHILFADERCVALDSEDSNYAGWKSVLFDALPGLPASQVYTCDASLGVAGAAEEYEAAMRTLYGEEVEEGGVPAIDVVLLGMGPDGHTASLFPGHALLDETSCWVASISDSPKPPPERITLTLPVLAASRLIMFMAAGASKAEALTGIFFADADLPAGRVSRAARDVRWFIDPPAAGDE
eukprot:PLAT7803.1.p1 GENE.PLAT7803.1~~PLAT7803.1.p1  ORF type:complete len:269 (-),score=87.65 PLAT7803.1:99-842(-)